MNYKLLAYAEDFVSFLLQKMDKRADKVKQIVLFGSAARGDATKDSDIDLFIEVTDEGIERDIKKIKEQYYASVKFKKYWQLFNVKNEINCSVGKLEEWDPLKRSIIANGIVLYGKYKGNMQTESYYLFTITPTKDQAKNVSVWRQLYGYTQKVGNKKYFKKGLVEEYNGQKLARGVFIIPADHAQKITSFLRINKFKHKVIPFHKETA